MNNTLKKRKKLNPKKLILLLGLHFSVLSASLNSYAQSQNTNKPAESKDQQTQTTSESSEASSKQSGITVLPAMTIRAATAGYVAKSSSSGTKTDTPLIEVPQSISVVTRNELDTRGVQDMSEALRYTPGVVVDQWGFEGRGYSTCFCSSGLTTSLS